MLFNMVSSLFVSLGMRYVLFYSDSYITALCIAIVELSVTSPVAVNRCFRAKKIFFEI